MSRRDLLERIRQIEAAIPGAVREVQKSPLFQALRETSRLTDPLTRYFDEPVTAGVPSEIAPLDRPTPVPETRLSKTVEAPLARTVQEEMAGYFMAHWDGRGPRRPIEIKTAKKFGVSRTTIRKHVAKAEERRKAATGLHAMLIACNRK